MVVYNNEVYSYLASAIPYSVRVRSDQIRPANFNQPFPLFTTRYR
ncbi:hypothetical protein PVAG01_05515 [Phlyctema vagabunda]|uniref:Uncharacterized protein n=1 Tax=Phlyctema vagabunda TaxID=108571 RepID=A0ABR4PKB1_9HELO